MKKLFVVGLSALMLASVSACGGGAKAYDETVRTAEDGVTVHAMGNYKIGTADNDWKGLEMNKMTAVSVKQVSEFSTALADKLNNKSLRWIYTIDINMDGQAGWDTLKLVKADGTFVDNANGSFAVKAQECTKNEDGNYVKKQWIPNPNDGSPAHVEALTDNIYMPPYQEAEDEHGMSWAENPALNTLEVGVYHLVVAKYTADSTNDVVGYGMGLVKVALQ